MISIKPLIFIVVIIYTMRGTEYGSLMVRIEFSGYRHSMSETNQGLINAWEGCVFVFSKAFGKSSDQKGAAFCCILKWWRWEITVVACISCAKENTFNGLIHLLFLKKGYILWQMIFRAICFLRWKQKRRTNLKVFKKTFQKRNRGI